MFHDCIRAHIWNFSDNLFRREIFRRKVKIRGAYKNKVRMCYMYLLTSLSFTVPNVIAVKFFCWCMYRYAGPDTRYSIEHMYTRLSAPRTPVSFFREIRLISYFDRRI